MSTQGNNGAYSKLNWRIESKLSPGEKNTVIAYPCKDLLIYIDANNQAHLRNLRTGFQKSFPYENVLELSYPNCCNGLICFWYYPRSIAVWDLHKMKCIFNLQNNNLFRGVQFDISGRFLLSRLEKIESVTPRSNVNYGDLIRMIDVAQLAGQAVSFFRKNPDVWNYDGEENEPENRDGDRIADPESRRLNGPFSEGPIPGNTPRNTIGTMSVNREDLERTRDRLSDENLMFSHKEDLNKLVKEDSSIPCHENKYLIIDLEEGRIMEKNTEEFILPEIFVTFPVKNGKSVLFGIKNIGPSETMNILGLGEILGFMATSSQRSNFCKYYSSDPKDTNQLGWSNFGALGWSNFGSGISIVKRTPNGLINFHAVDILPAAFRFTEEKIETFTQKGKSIIISVAEFIEEALQGEIPTKYYSLNPTEVFSFIHFRGNPGITWDGEWVMDQCSEAIEIYQRGGKSKQQSMNEISLKLFSCKEERDYFPLEFSSSDRVEIRSYDQDILFLWCPFLEEYMEENPGKPFVIPSEYSYQNFEELFRRLVCNEKIEGKLLSLKDYLQI